MSPMYVDVHVVQTVPPSNLNRDDTGAPKSAVYGGVRRARVSSQAWKRAVRKDFASRLDASDLGVRTKRLVELVVDHMIRDNPALTREEAVARASATLKAAGLVLTEPKAKRGTELGKPGEATTTYLVFVSRRQVERLAALAATYEGGPPTKKEAQEAFDREHGIEVALFGRMVADDKELSVDASVQVAHALSTHAVEEEGDYFTAVDDRTPDDETGAGMLGTVEFNSATLYRYATINIDGLEANLGDREATARAVDAFVQDFAKSMPTGKQNTFANRTVPDGVLIMVRGDQPVNLVGAFEDPVTDHGTEGRVHASIQRLVEQARSVDSFVEPPLLTSVVVSGRRGTALSELGVPVSLRDAAAATAQAVRSRGDG